jgi:hypothetical protein
MSANNSRRSIAFSYHASGARRRSGARERVLGESEGRSPRMRLVFDGVFAGEGDAVGCHSARRLTRDEVAQVVAVGARRIDRRLQLVPYYGVLALRARWRRAVPLTAIVGRPYLLRISKQHWGRPKRSQHSFTDAPTISLTNVSMARQTPGCLPVNADSGQPTP